MISKVLLKSFCVTSCFRLKGLYIGIREGDIDLAKMSDGLLEETGNLSRFRDIGLKNDNTRAEYDEVRDRFLGGSKDMLFLV